MSDLIDRQALKQALGINADDCDKCAWGSYGRCKRGSDFEDACCAIDDAPSAEPKTGKWLVRTRHEHYPSGKEYQETVCSLCGRTDHNGDGSYCGYCGAKMEVQDE